MDVPVRAPDGTLGTIPAEQVEAARAAGYTAATADEVSAAAAQKAAEEQYGGASGMVGAGAAGLARGVTLGASDALLTSTGLVAPATLRGLQDANPGISAGTEGLGMLAPAVISDGAALGVEGAEGAGALGKLARMATAPGRAVSALGEGAARLGESIGLGRAGAATVRGAVEAPLYQVASNLSEDAINDKPYTASSLFEHVPEAALFGGLASGAVDKALGAIAERAPKLLESASAKLSELGDRAAPLEEKAAAAGGALQELEAKGGGLPEQSDLFAAAKPGAEAEKTRALTEAREAVGAAVEDFTARARPAMTAQLLGDAPANPQVAEAVAHLRAMLPAEASAGLEKIATAPTLAEQHLALEIAAQASPAAAPALRQIAQSPAFGSAGGYAARMDPVLERLRQATAALELGGPASVAGYRSAASSALQAMQETTYKYLSGHSPSLPGMLGAVADHAGSWGEAAGMHALAGGLGLAHLAGPLGALASPVGKKAMQLGLEGVRVLRGGQSATISGLLRRGAETSAAIASGVRAALSDGVRSGSSRAASVATVDRRPFETRGANLVRRIETVRALAANPASHASQLAGGAPALFAQAPGVAAAYTGKVSLAAGYLASVAPHDPRPPSPMPGRPKWQPSPSEADTYRRIERAVVKPLSVVSDLRAGELVPEVVAAVQAVHPEFYQRMVQEMAHALAGHVGEVPYEMQLQLDVLMPQPVSQMAQALPGMMAAAQAAGSTPGTPRAGREHHASTRVSLNASRAAALPGQEV